MQAAPAASVQSTSAPINHLVRKAAVHPVSGTQASPQPKILAVTHLHHTTQNTSNCADTVAWLQPEPVLYKRSHKCHCKSRKLTAGPCGQRTNSKVRAWLWLLLATQQAHPMPQTHKTQGTLDHAPHQARCRRDMHSDAHMCQSVRQVCAPPQDYRSINMPQS